MSTVLITGGAKRIGIEIAKLFARKGYNIALHYNTSRDVAQSESKKIAEQYNVRCKIYQYDLSSMTKVKDLFPEILKDFPEINILINNASVFEQSDFVTTSLENIMINFNIHYFVPLLLSQAFAKQDNLQKGLIINMLDCNTTKVRTKYFAYLQSKKALLSLTQYLAVTLSPNIRTNAISPGFIIPEENTIPDKDYITNKLKNIPMQKQGNITHILQAIEYIILSEYVNGQNLFVDGGANL